MALSEKEQEMLAQMEAALAAEDPKLASTLKGSSPRAVHRRRASLAAVGFVAGIAVLIGGLSVNWVVSVLGFILMVVSTVVALTSWSQASGTRAPRTRDAQDSLQRLEDQWRRKDDTTSE